MDWENVLAVENRFCSGEESAGRKRYNESLPLVGGNKQYSSTGVFD
jgi:hypothetical protein